MLFLIQSRLLFVHVLVLVFILLIGSVYDTDRCNLPPVPSSGGGCIATTIDPPLSEEVIEALKNAVLNVSPNKTVVVKNNDPKDASFEIIFDGTDIPDDLTVNIVSFINDCHFSTADSSDRIKCEDINWKNILSRKCTFKNLSTSSNIDFAKVQYFLLVNRKNPLAFAYFTCISPSYLLVEEEPSEVSVLDYTIDPCKGVSLVFSSISPDTHLVCRLHDNDDESTPLYHEICGNDTLIPAKVFHNHTGIYTLVVTPKKSVAKGVATNFTIDLGKEAIKVDIKHLSLFLIGNEFFAFIVLKVDHTCPLTVPNYVYPISTCFEMKKIEKIMNSSEVNIKRIVKWRQRLCTLQAEDSGGNVIHYNETFNTFVTQNAIIEQVSDNKYSISCELVFVQNNDSVGCCIEYTRERDSNSTNSSTKILSATMSSNKAGFIKFNDPGTYWINVLDRGDKDNEPVVRTSVIYRPNPTSLSLLPNITIENSEDGTNVNGLAIAVGALCFIPVLVIIILAVYAVLRRKSNRNGGGLEMRRNKAAKNDQDSGSTTQSK